MSLVRGVTRGSSGGGGTNGKSAYELAVDNGFVGTLAAWLASLQGTNGTGTDIAEIITFTGSASNDTTVMTNALATNRPIIASAKGSQIARFNAGFTMTNRDVDIDLSNVKVIQVSNNTTFTVDYGEATSIAVTSLTNALLDLGGGEDTLVGKAGLADTSAIVLYEWYTLSSDDKPAEGATSGENARCGQKVLVISKDASFVYFSHPIYDLAEYVTNITIARLNGQDYKAKIKAYIEVDPTAVSSNWTGLPLLVNGAVNGDFDLECNLVTNVVVAATGCVNSDFKFRVKRVHRPGFNGYGALLSAGWGNRVNARASRMRHAVTTNWTNGASGAKLRRGWEFYPQITGVFQNSDAAAVDLHGDCIGGVIHDFIAAGVTAGPPDGTSTCVQLRGVDTEAVNGRGEANWGAQIFDGNAPGGGRRQTLRDCKFKCRNGVILGLGLSSSNPKPTYYIDGGEYECAGVEVIRATNCTIKFLNEPLFRVTGQSGGTIIRMLGNGKVYGKFRIDMSGSAGTWDLLFSSGSGNEAIVEPLNSDAIALAGDADYTVTDFSPELIVFSTPLTANRQVNFSCEGRRQVEIRRTAAATGAFNLILNNTAANVNLGAGQGALAKIIGTEVLTFPGFL